MMADDHVNTASGRLKGDIARIREDLIAVKDDMAVLARRGKAAGKATSARLSRDVAQKFAKGRHAASGQFEDAVASNPAAVLGGSLALGLVLGVAIGALRP